MSLTYDSLLLDIGSTSIKWATFDGAGRRLGTQHASFPLPTRQQGPYFEVCPDAIMAIVDRAITDAGPISRMAIATQMHGYLLADADHRLITPYISWQDSRALLTDYSSLTMPTESGSALKPNLPVLSLRAMEACEPEVYAKAATFYTLGSYVAWRLTGHNITHITDAAATGFYHGQTASRLSPWHRQIAIPEARQTFGVAGTYGRCEILTPVGDQQASALGSDLEDDQYLLNLGTAAQLCTLAAASTYGAYESRPWLDGRTLCTVTGLPGGRELVAGVDEHSLLTAWGDALARLPARGRLLVVGGAAAHHRPLIERVLDRMGVSYQIRAQCDALDGLQRLLTERTIDGL